ncbi:MAG: ACP S-malonyltransferase [Gammaproteobacteria bacterium]
MSKSIGLAFPGQGSQSPGMLPDHFSSLPIFDDVFSKAKDVLGIDFKNLINEGSADELSSTEITQPLLLTANYAIWKSLGIKPEEVSLMAGHSLGEYSAYVAAEALSFEDALKLVSHRARYMQQAVPEGEGGIAAILGLSREQLSLVCDEVTASGNLVSMANLNSDTQIVISGTKQGVDLAVNLSKERGAKRAVPLAMSVPSHCKLMTPASIQFTEELNKINFSEPKTKVIQNFSVEHSDDPEIIKNNLVSQLYSPVRWAEIMDLYEQANISHFYECGPGKVLCGLIKRKFKNIEINSLEDINILNSIKAND